MARVQGGIRAPLFRLTQGTQSMQSVGITTIDSENDDETLGFGRQWSFLLLDVPPLALAGSVLPVSPRPRTYLHQQAPNIDR